MKLELCHAETCLPDYWSGHHKAHIQIPVWSGMTMAEIKRAIVSELSQGAVSGSDDLAFLLSADYVTPARDLDARRATRAAYAAVNRLKPAKKGQRRFFTDLETSDDDDCSESVYAFFVFVELE